MNAAPDPEGARVPFEKMTMVVCAMIVLDATPLGIGTADANVAVLENEVLEAAAVLEVAAVLEATVVLATGPVLAASGIGLRDPEVDVVTVTCVTEL